MGNFRFITGVQFDWNSAIYEVTGIIPGQKITLVNQETGEYRTEPLAALLHALFVERTLKFVITGRAAKRQVEGKASTDYDYAALDDCQPHLVVIARWRLSAIQPILDLPLPQRTRAVIAARVEQVKGEIAGGQRSLATAISVASMYRWIGDYTESRNDLRSLIPATQRRGGDAIPRIGSDLEATIAKVINESIKRRERVSIDDIHQMVAAELADEDKHLPDYQRRVPPSRTTVARRVDAVDVERKLVKKRGSREAKRELQQYGHVEYPTFPLECVELDHTKTDLIVIDDFDNLPLGRLNLTFGIEMSTRYPWGYYLGFEPPSYYSVAQCLYHGICVKPSLREKYSTEHEWLAYGIAGAFRIDNGKEWVGKDLRDAAALLGTVIQVCPVRTPEFKAGIERMLRTTAYQFFHTISGTTFSSPRERGDYDSAKQACIYLSEIDRMLSVYIVDIYAEQFHRGLGAIPARAWERKLTEGFLPRLPASQEELSILLGQVDQRNVWHYGIDWDNLRYNTSELGVLRHRLKGSPAKVKRNPGDLSRIYVFDPFERRYIEVPVISVGQEYTQNLSLWKHRVICEFNRATGDQMDFAALGRAKQKIQALVDASRDRKKISTRTRVARWETTGRQVGQASTVVEPHSNVPAEQPAMLPEAPGSPPVAVPVPPIMLESVADDDWEIAPMPRNESV